MIKVGKNTYKTLQLDTNALSNLLKEDDSILNNLLKKFPPDKYVFCYSPFSILEIRRKETLTNRFCKLFSIYPSFFLKGYEQIRSEEISNYNESKEISEILFSPLDIRRKKGQFFPEPEQIKEILYHPNLEKVFNKWENDKEDILKGMLSLKKNFQPKNDKYTKKEIEYFIKEATIQQLMMYDPKFVKSKILSKRSIDLSKFPSFKIMSFTVFYKFYADQRNPQISDVFDILIGANVPYVDAFITEKHFYDTLIKIKKIDSFIDKKEIFKINEF